DHSDGCIAPSHPHTHTTHAIAYTHITHAIAYTHITRTPSHTHTSHTRHRIHTQHTEFVCYSFFQSCSLLSQYDEHFSQTLHTVDLTDTHLSISVNLWCKMNYN